MTYRAADAGSGVVVALVGEDEVVRARLGRDADAGGSRAPHLVQGRGRREVDHVDRRIGGPGERHGPRGRDGLDVRRSRARVEPRRDVATRQGGRHGRVKEDRILAMDLEHPAARTHERHRVVQGAIGEAEVEHHERLRGRDAGIDGGGQLGERVVHPAAHDEAQAVVDGTVRVRRGAPLAQAGRAGSARPPATSRCPGC